MLSLKEILLEQFTSCYDENGWFVALRNAVGEISPEQAAWKTANLDNSIWEILAHLNFYNDAYLKRFKGIAVNYSGIRNSETFAGPQNASETAWQAEIEKFDAIMNEWRALLEAADDGKFDEAVSATNKSLWGSTLAHINIHNAHHAGQIVIIRKLQGSWDPGQGVS